MPRPAISWLITDTHINHEFMFKCGRPRDYVEWLRRACCEVVAAQDTIYHLGDVIFYRSHELKPWLDSIPGRKILVRGNHDKKPNGWYERNGFSFVADSIQLGSVVLSHKPIRSLPDGACFNIHGHWHDNDHRRDESYSWYIPGCHIKLAIEDTKYRPVNLQKWIGEQVTGAVWKQRV